MYCKEDAWMLRRIFLLSDIALIRMINQLFQTEYGPRESIWKEWQEQDAMSVCVRIGGTNRYEFRMRRMEGCIQISAEDRGCVFCYENMTSVPAVRVREPRVLCFGRGRQEIYSTMLEFPGNERVKLDAHIITIEKCSATELEKKGLILFLPFLFYCFSLEPGKERERQEALKCFMVNDMAGTLNRSYQRGNLTAFDTQRLKQLCRQMAWRFLGRESWMQELEMQEFVLKALEADLDFLERKCRVEFVEKHLK